MMKDDIEMWIVLILCLLHIILFLILGYCVFRDMVERIYDKPLKLDAQTIWKDFNFYIDSKFGVKLLERFIYVHDWNNRPTKISKDTARQNIPK